MPGERTPVAGLVATGAGELHATSPTRVTRASFLIFRQYEQTYA